MKQRPFADLPRRILAIAMLAFILQIVIHLATAKPTATAQVFTTATCLAQRRKPGRAGKRGQMVDAQFAGFR